MGGLLDRDHYPGNLLDLLDSLRERIAGLERRLSGGGGSGTIVGPATPDLSGEPYVVMSQRLNLSAERVLTEGDGIDVTDGGAGSTVTVAVDVTDILGSGVTESSNNIDLDWGTPTIGTIECDDSQAAGSSTNPARSDHQHAIVCAAPTGNLSSSSTNSEGTATSFARSDHSHAIDDLTALPNAQFVTLALSDDLGAERVLTAGDGIDVTDAGANSTVTVAVDVTDLLGNGLTESSNNIDVDPAELITGGNAEVDGDKLDIDWTPSNYTPATTPSEVDNADNLTAHLYGIDQVLGGVGADLTDEQFLVLSYSGDLSVERLFTPGDGLDGTDAGAGSTYTLSVDVTDILGSGVTESSNNIDLDWGTPTIGTIECDDSASAGSSTNPARSDHQHAIVCAAPTTNLSDSSTNSEGTATSFARSDHTHAVDGITTDISGAQYVVMALSGDLSAERVLTAGDGLDLTDGGANGNATVAVDVTDLLGNGLGESSNNIYAYQLRQSDDGAAALAADASGDMTAYGGITFNAAETITTSAGNLTVSAASNVVCQAGSSGNVLMYDSSSNLLGSFQDDGDLSLGRIETNKANIFVDYSTGRINFRGGTNGTEVGSYIDTDGSIVGNVEVHLTGVITPPQTILLTANADDYDPGSDEQFVRVNADGEYDITGWVGGEDGKWLMLHNIHPTYDFTVKHESASSTAANRFINASGADIVLPYHACAWYIYHGDRWRQVLAPSLA